MIRLGGVLNVKSDDPSEIARAHRDFGFTAAYCPDVSIHDKERIQAIRQAFAKEDVVISEVGAWCNLIGPEEEERKRNIAYVCERLALADEIGALSCIDFIGSMGPTLNPKLPHEPHPDNLTEKGFEVCVDTVRSIIDQVKPKRAKFCLEFMQFVLPDSPEVCLDLIKAIDREAFAAHIDPVNIILTPRQYFNNGELIKRCFALLGPWIIGFHAKDIILKNQLALHFDEARVGLGYLDYRIYLREIHKLGKDLPLMLEHLRTEEEFAAARDHLKSVGREIEVPFRD